MFGAALVAAFAAGPAAAARASASPAKAPARPAVVRLELSPPALHLVGRGARETPYVTAVLADGETRDVTSQARLAPLSPVVRAAEGSLVAVRDGQGQVAVLFGGRKAILPVRVSSAARERPVSFLYDVLPILTRAGCNQGSCHGNAEGRGGLKLSLKGEFPEGDYEALVRQGGGRRIDRMEPARSLMLLKASSTLPHGGGLRLREGSPDYRVVATWIAEGARFDPPEAPRLVRLEVRPRERVLIAPASVQRLSVLGYFSDGSVRNLAHRAYFNSGDPLVQVDPTGLVRGRAGGDAAVLVRYADRMAHARLTFVPERKQFAWRPVPTFNWIDAINDRRLRLLRLRPSRLTTDAEFLRRAYLDACGILPTPDEVRRFLSDPSPDKRSRLIDQLLERPEFVDYWAMKWADLLRIEERSLDPRGSMAYRDWIRGSLAQGKPMDRFAYELLTASGSTYANPPANYYRRTRNPIDLAETTAQVFLGTRMLCARCHNHPFERWKQDDYYALAAFFARIERKGELTRKDRFDKHELIGEETIGVAAEGEVEHPRTGRPVLPRLPGASEPLDLPPGADRRVPLAQWLTSRDNPLFARSLVNRIWYHLMGRGLVEPADDMRDSNPPANPELLDALTRDFVASGFDLQHVVRTIMNSRTYQTASEPNETNADDERFFSRGIPQRLPAEVLLDALCQVTEVPEIYPGYPEGTRAVLLVPVKRRHPFLKLFGQPQRESVCECERSNEGTLGQSFALISGETLNAKLRRPDNRIGRLLAAGRTDAEIVTELYLAAVSREPKEGELRSAVSYIRSKPDRRAAIEDFLWALLNSKEFLLRR